jgi:predicted phage baseplate assembly protein
MTGPVYVPLVCADDQRRRQVRRQGRTGIDWIEPEQDPRVLRVGFLGRAPALTPAHVRIEGGRRITGLRVVHVRRLGNADPDLDDQLELTVDRAGDLSTYTLRLVDTGDDLLDDVDPRYRVLGFSFVAGCPSDLDCAPVEDCPSPAVTEPDVSYLAKDYASFRQLILDRLALLMPGWTERHIPDIGITLVELLAYVGDYVSYHQDAVATEAYLGTARKRISVRRHARLVDYRMPDGCNARAWVCVEASAEGNLEAGSFYFATGAGAAAGDESVAFEPMLPRQVRVRPAHNTIRFWTWGDQQCFLPAGASRATLRDERRPGARGAGNRRALDLREGDVLVLEEVLGPCTGLEADADPAHRQAVRLTRVTPGVDPAYDQPVLEVEWGADDALDFPLCLSAVTGPECTLIEPSVARGNVVLADHGRTITFCGAPPEPIEALQVDEEPAGCAGPGDPLDPVLRERWGDRQLAQGPLTSRATFPSPGQVSAAQADRLAGIPDRFRARLRRLRRQASSGEPLSPDQIDEVRVVFPDRVLNRVGFPLPEPRSRRPLPAGRQAAALTRLLDDPRLSAARTRWLDDLARRARAGLVLGDDQLAEVAQAWGPAYVTGLAASEPALAGPARTALAQDPAAALPALDLFAAATGTRWRVRPDLLGSGPDDPDVVVETEDDGIAHLRFGDGDLGQRPAPGTAFVADYRLGNGTAGNVGAGAIDHLVFCAGDPGVVRSVRNPLPAQGGVDPEPLAEVRATAPGAFRRRLQRAVTAEDYAVLAAAQPDLQGASARLRWTGSWYDAEVAVDPRGTDAPAEALLERVREGIFRYRRIGHGLVVDGASYVPLLVRLRVCVLPEHAQDRIRARLTDLLGARMLPGGERGFFHPDAVTFGADIEVGRLIAVAASVPGVEMVEVLRLERLGDGDRGERSRGFLRVGPFEIPRLDNDPAQPENGRLEVEIGGGR